MMLLTIMLFYLPTTVLNLQCMPPGFVEKITLEKFDLSQLEYKLSLLNSSDHQTECELEIFVDYRKQEVILAVVKNRTEMNSDTIAMLELSTKIRVFNRTSLNTFSETTNLFRIKCNIGNWCDRQIALDHISWLREIDYRNLENAISLVLFNKDAESGKAVKNVRISFEIEESTVNFC